MDQSPRKNKRVAGLEPLSEETVRGIHKANEDYTLETNGDFRGSWVGTSPLPAMSTRAMVMPMVLIPGKFARVVSVTLKPNLLALVSPGLARADVVKWEERARVG
ncbi:hypothetical protein F3Y22_tig00110114pilonHSYRG00182 [Hibiscus syriacus]|uniref:Uncharacterized protein n=1 Tax=Hibiscus syriacus TaxID=106335 RepID=A0A6A3BJQ1_HIBSY|nr:hypothetical protein F3Y22_tig00110114pilonHSYRG00182 [Hibiscus syriacus]